MPEDRDQRFEKALVRHLRAESAASSPCLDPETLAAYHERTLSPAELASAKSHIVSCARCQQILAELEVTQELDQRQETAEVVPAVAVAAPSSSELYREVSPPAVITAQASPEKVVAIPSKRFASLRWAAPAGAIAAALLVWIGVRDLGMLRKSPSEAAQISANRRQEPAPSAADESKSSGLLKEKEAERQKSDASSADALNETAPAPHSLPVPPPSLLDEGRESASAGRLEQKDQKLGTRDAYGSSARTANGAGRGPTAPSAQNQAHDALGRGDQSVLGGAAQKAEKAASDLDKARPQKAAPEPLGRTADLAKAVAAPSLSKRLPGRLRGTVTDPSGAAVAGANVQLQADSGRTIASTSTDTAGTFLFSGVAEGNYQLQLASPGFRTDILTGLNIQAGENVMNARLELGAASETVQVAAQAPVVASSNSQVAELRALPELKSKNSLELLVASPGFASVASPDGKSVWKFGEAGQILHATSGGKEWTSQVSGVTVKLLSASAPSAKVCWVAGASGTLLRTADGGKHWQRVTVPMGGDLGGVHASDAKHASIWDAPSRVSYETSDGGRTWKRIANE
jgi:carboxypeptidase family protein/photosynthesis system II assembly factor YCF48-like protein